MLTMRPMLAITLHVAGCVDNRTRSPTFMPMPDAPNLLVPPPPYDHNDDPDLRRDPVSGKYELLYLETLRPDRQTLVALRSQDLVHWSRRDAIVYEPLAGPRASGVSAGVSSRSG